MLYKNLFQLYPDNFQNNYFLLSDKLEDIRYYIYIALINFAACRQNPELQGNSKSG